MSHSCGRWELEDHFRGKAGAAFKVVRYGPATYTHSFRAHDASFFDAKFAAFVRESYVRGSQEHRNT